ncbi:2-oxoacid:acceptor oxidoreductase subunit alpha [Kosmotoga olearia]|uniref:Pyruvate flavodoxin/ferredoxin oxidoreductase domain protein n=1 Tax=Kosmotoga olearia (strain ATCC BAA-1733 / DSM 21960 / TBF 19.5.1) TaxID=521045 RepID=C5CIB2_KOSOT|nr:2-oxoacid:acceptor oxidoreductase subunit alpha [Kosmotoga olearia]ACR80814.1 pyruvate flavodoxin/ferredoxin oxidoreductase domain protein [Kosmotoga olearia TBF 19.5.1]
MKELVIAISGEAGQGIQTAGNLAAKALFRAGYNVFTDKSYHSRIRGGEYIYRIRVSEYPVYAMREEVDLVASLSSVTTNTLERYIHSNTVVVADKEDVGHKFEPIRIKFKERAKGAGNPRTLNTVIVGAILKALDVPVEIPIQLITDYFTSSEQLLESNIKALKNGYEISLDLSFKKIPKNRENERLLLNGTEGTGLGAIAAGCRFISAYPMTPGTGVMLFLAKRAEKYSIVVEQAEDEIAAINMAIGASFAGVRSMVTTSGGGFALMQEGVSLAGMTETPVVIVDAQRPAPATGLPTRTAQEDLYFVLKSGHGEFPRYICAPRTSKEAFELTEKAFYLADKYQIPAFVLLSQQLVDSQATIEPPVHRSEYSKRFLIKSDEGLEYKRYQLTKNGVSPRAIPGGDAIVRADSDEHDEYGFITEDLEIRAGMVEKRNKKLESLQKEIASPLTYNLEADTILVGWGDSWGAIDEFARKRNLGYVHYNELYPLNLNIFDQLKNKRLITVEGNYTGQFAELLASKLYRKVEHIGRYDGRPITANWLDKKLEEVGKI